LLCAKKLQIAHEFSIYPTSYRLSINIYRRRRRSATNPPAAAAAVGRWDRQTGRRTDVRPLYRPCSTNFAGSVKKEDFKCSVSAYGRHCGLPAGGAVLQMTPLLLCPLYTDTTKQSCLCRVGRGGVNWTVLLLKRSDFNRSVGDSLELSRIQFTPPRQTRRGQDCFVWPGGVNSVSVLLSL